MQSSSTSAGSGRAIVVDGLKKAYGSTQALRGLSLTVGAGQIVGVVGPNGAGKSTFVRVLAGEENEDGGTIAVGGTALAVEQRRHLVAVVHQEPQLFPNLSVVENLMIDNLGLRRPRPTRQVLALLERMRLSSVANAPLENTSIMVWQLTEIARALLRSAQVFLFDEPNSALTKVESQQLFEHMTTLRDAGKFVFLVSHRLGEVAEVCSQVVVVRDGTVVASLSGEALSSDRLSSLLIAEEFGPSVERTGPGASGAARRETGATADHVFRGDHVGHVGPRRPGGKIADHIEGAPGIVVAVTGPEGGGGRELARAARIGAMGGGDDARHVVSAHMPADRRECLFFNMSVAANISARLAAGQLAGRSGFVSRRALARAAASHIERFNIKTEHAGSSVGSLSGGNQQKVALASALAVGPALLVIEEPTRGVDIKTKLQIYEILRDFTSSGGAVVMFVNELEDAIGCADYLYVVSDGSVRGYVEINRTDDLEQLGLVVNRLVTGKSDAA